MTTFVPPEDLGRRRPYTSMIAFMLLTPLFAVIASGMGALFYIGVPTIDALANPVITLQEVRDVTLSNNGRRVCWEWIYVKAQEATPQKIAFEVQDRRGEGTTVTPIRQDNGKTLDTKTVRLPGPQHIPLCVDLPDEVNTPYVIIGHFEYKTAGRLWHIHQDTLPVHVGMPKPAAPGVR